MQNNITNFHLDLRQVGQMTSDAIIIIVENQLLVRKNNMHCVLLSLHLSNTVTIIDVNTLEHAFYVYMWQKQYSATSQTIHR